jgi:hypothetical protein
LARQGFKVFATDLSTAAITDDCERKAARDDMKAVSTSATFLSRMRKAVVNKARGEQGGNLNLYNRFFLHSLDDEQGMCSLTALASATR